MSKKGGSPPPAPDPYQTAAAQGQANVQAIDASAQVNTPNLYGPAGSITYTRNAQGVPTAQYVNLTPEGQAIFNQQQNISGTLTDQAWQRVNELPTTPFSLTGAPYDPSSYNVQSNFPQFNPYSNGSVPGAQSYYGYGSGMPPAPMNFGGSYGMTEPMMQSGSQWDTQQASNFPAQPMYPGQSTPYIPANSPSTPASLTANQQHDQGLYGPGGSAYAYFGGTPGTPATPTISAHGKTPGQVGTPAVPGLPAQAGGFDQTWYQQQYGSTVPAGMDPYTYWSTVGYKAGQNPNAYFNTQSFMAANPGLTTDPLTAYDKNKSLAGAFASPSSTPGATAGSVNQAMASNPGQLPTVQSQPPVMAYGGGAPGMWGGGQSYMPMPPMGFGGGYGGGYGGYPSPANGAIPYNPSNINNIPLFDQNVGHAIFNEQAQMLAPQFAMQNQQFMQNMADRGMPVGESAYNYGLQQLAQNQNLAWQQAADQATAASTGAAQSLLGQEMGVNSQAFGQALQTNQQQAQDYLSQIQLEQNLRNTAIQNALQARTQNLNEASAYLQGSPVLQQPQAPQMPNYNVAPAPISQDVYNSYNAQLQSWEAQQQQAASMWGGIGNILGAGATLMFGSSKRLKHEDGPPTRILDALKKIPVRTWKYLPDYDPSQEQHIGPYAEDWHEQLGLGDGTKIDVRDALGVCLQAIKELQEEIGALRAAFNGGR